MKKIIVALMLTSFAVFAAWGQTGVIREISGEVEIKPADASAFSAASAGDEIALNTVVSTGFRSTALIAVGSSLITVRPLTRLSLAEIQSSANVENVNVSLQTGRVKVDVKPAAGTKANLKIQSPSATASVRGTSFEFDTVNLSVTEGRVAFGGNNGAAAMVDAGGTSFVTTDGTTADPVVVAVAALLPQTPVGAPPAETMASSPQVTSSSVGTNVTVTLTYPSIPNTP